MKKNIPVLIALSIVVILSNCSEKQTSYYDMAVEVLKDSTLQIAKRNISEEPITVTASSSSRSTGGIHDFYSEGDYWWPDTTNLEGPYVRRDGITNPNNFTDHRKALVRLSEIVANMTSAYIITKDDIYADAAVKHLTAWFVNDDTKMNPNLLYAQAIKGRHTGRGIGIIDGIHLMEVVQSIIILEKNGKIDPTEVNKMRAWFSDFVQWLTTHKYGLDEMVHPNNHGTCWNMQVGIYASFTKNEKILNQCRDRYKNNLLPKQMAKDGSFPLEMARTKPYGYALFNLDAMVMNCLILSNDSNDLWKYTTEEGTGILQGLEYMKPYVADKSSWPLEPDVMYWDNWPVAHPSFLFGGVQFKRDDFIELWKKNKHFLEVKEVRRNVPIRNPLLWLNASSD